MCKIARAKKIMKPRLDIHFSVSQRLRFVFGKPYEPTDDEFLLNHNRSAIVLALKALHLGDKAGIGTMAYNCHTLMNAIEQSGCQPVFVDVNDDLTINMEDLQRKISQISTLIVTHLFGIVNNVQAIKEEFPNLIIIEDCAHAYGIKHLYGDFAAFSTGQGKFPSIGDGGVLLVRNELYKSRVISLYDDLPEYSRLQSAMLFLKMLMQSWLNSRLVYSWLTLPLKQRRSVVSGKEVILPKKMCKGIRAIYSEEIGHVPQNIARRVENVEKLKMQTVLKDNAIQSLVGINAFMLVIRCQYPERLQKKLRALGLDSATHFSNALVWAKEFGYCSGDCPNTEKMINQLLMIPTY